MKVAAGLFVLVSLCVCVESGFRNKRQASQMLERMLAQGKSLRYYRYPGGPSTTPSTTSTTTTASTPSTEQSTQVETNTTTTTTTTTTTPTTTTTTTPTTTTTSSITTTTEAPLISSITASELQIIQTSIQELMRSDPDLIANWVQLSFHECFGPNGCNGCLDITQPANRGLARTFTLVQMLRENIAPTLTNADFIALLGSEAAKAGAVNGGGSLNMPYSIGRRDCQSRQSDAGIPSGERLDTIELLKGEFGLTTREAVALIGAHSLGRARPENTGFSGPWDRSESSLESGYYFVMFSNNLTPERVNNSRATSTQWKTNGFLMLHADLIVRKQFTTSGEFDEPSCGFSSVTDCADQPETASIAMEYFDRTIFHTEFEKAFLKMISKSNHELTLVE